MKSPFIIYVDRLEEGKEQKIDDSLDPSFMDIQENELIFKKNILFSGKAYIANDYLVIQGKIKASAMLPCLICNELTELPLSIDHFYHTEKLSDIKGAQFDYQELIREQILVDIPHYIECNQGKCPERKNIAQYMKKPSADEALFPFKSL